MARQRIPEWESRKALALHLFDRSPLTAQYPGEMAHKLARTLDKNASKVGPWSPHQALRIAKSLADTGHLAIEGVSKITRITWIGQTDPNLIDWEPVRPPKPEDVSRIGRLEAQVAGLQDQVDRIPELVRQALDLALEAWTQ